MVIFIRKTFLLTFCWLVISCAHEFPRGNEAYVVVSVEALGGSEHPRWIGLEGPFGIVHVSANDQLVSVPAGDYVIDHFDFNENFYNDRGSIIARSSLKKSFHVDESVVNYLGVIQLVPGSRVVGGSRRYGLKFLSSNVFLKSVCEDFPGPFSGRPVRDVLFSQFGDEFFMDCEKV